jgi:phosphoadenosine phosphosulfate reductase
MANTFFTKVEYAKKLIKEYLDKYPKSAVSLSFGKDSVVLVDLVRQVKKDVPMFAVLADTEFPETINFRNELVQKWNLNYKEYNFINESEKGVEDCCRALKVDKFKEAVKDLDCWFSGIRKDEGITRGDFKEIEERGALVKVNPILHFTEKDIWRYTGLYNLPVNPAYKLGYRSLSCKLCSVKEHDENESERAGRWKGTSHEGGECGIHTQTLKDVLGSKKIRKL